MPRLWRKRVSKRTAYEQVQYVKEAAKSGDQVHFTDGSSSDDSNHGQQDSQDAEKPNEEAQKREVSSPEQEDNVMTVARSLREQWLRDIEEEKEAEASITRRLSLSRTKMMMKKKKKTNHQNEGDSM
jgi:hypothetical protein